MSLMQPGDDAEETAPNEKRPVTAASSVQNLQTNVPYRFDRKKYPHGGRFRERGFWNLPPWGYFLRSDCKAAAGSWSANK